MLSANEGKIMNTFIKRSLISISLALVSGLSGPEAVRTSSIPRMPNVIEAQINIRVAILCMILVYQKRLCDSALWVAAFGEVHLLWLDRRPANSQYYCFGRSHRSRSVLVALAPQDEVPRLI